MTYQTWLEKIELLSKKQYNIQILEELESIPYNNTLEEMLTPKLQELITTKTNNAISDILSNLEYIFNDINELDYNLVKLKKEIKFIIRIINLNQIPSDKKNYINKKFKEDIQEVYKILKNEADIIDYTGSFSQIIKNNEYNWSE